MRPLSLVAWAVCLVLGSLTFSSRVEGATTAATPTAAASQIVKQINRVNDDGSYTIGFEAADGTFKIETRDSNGNVKGMFGFLDKSGHIKKVAYSTSNATESPSPQNVEDINTVTEFNPSSSSTTKRPPPSYLRTRSRSSPANIIKYRRPIPDTESPDDDSPVFAMLLRRSRQGLPTRSDADELLRLQQQNDASDVYGSSVGSQYQVPDTPFRQHFLQGGRGRINNAVLNHHLRQLTPDQLYELQQYASSVGNQAAPEPTYVPRVPQSYTPTPIRGTMNPVLQYLSGNNVVRDSYDQSYTTRYPPYPATTPYPAQPQYYYPPTQASYYPSQTYAGYNGLTSARSYPYQNPNLPEELRQALIYRMLLAARLLGLDGLISPRYPTTPVPVEDPRTTYAGDQYYEDPRMAAYNPRTPATYYQDPRQYYTRPVYQQSQQAYQPQGYYNTLAIARANHARQLAAYQQSLLTQDQQRQYVRPGYNGVQDLGEDPAIIELRRQFGDPAVANQHRYQYQPNPVIYRVGVQQQESGSSDDEYSTATPSSSPSISSTTPSSGSNQRVPTERPTPSYIQRVRSVQVLNPATAAPRGSSTTISPTTRRSLAP